MANKISSTYMGLYSTYSPSNSEVEIFRSRKSKQSDSPLSAAIVSTEGGQVSRPRSRRPRQFPEKYPRDRLKLERSSRPGQFIVEEAILDAKLPEIGLHGHGRHVRN